MFDSRMVVGGRWYLVPVLLFGVHEFVELDQLGASVTLLIPTVLLFRVPSLILGWNSSSSTHPRTRPMLTATHYDCSYIDLVGTVLFQSTVSN